MKFGLNLFSIRSKIQTEEEFLKTAEILKELGYDYLQYSGAEWNAERIKRVSEKSGLPVYLTHSPVDRILNDTEKLMEEHSLLGCKNIGLGSVMPEVFLSEKEIKETFEKLERAAEKMEKNGFKFFYHNHHNEFYKYDGKHTAIDYVLQNTKHINFTLDVYWAQYGGANVLELLEDLEGRVGCVHLKDYKLVNFGTEEKVDFKPKFAPVGEGTMNFKTIIEKMKEVGAEYFFVEQDDAVEYDDPIGEVGRSIKYLKENF